VDAAETGPETKTKAETETEAIVALQRDANAIFSIIDTDGDGSITRDELTKHMSKAGYAADAVDKIFNALDANDDGSISRPEFRSGLAKFAKLRSAPGLGSYNAEFVKEIRDDADYLFKLLDTDNNGSISRDELQNHLTYISQSVHMTKYTDAAIDNIFSLLDVNDDGEVSREELRDAFARYSALRQALGEGPNYK